MLIAVHTGTSPETRQSGAKRRATFAGLIAGARPGRAWMRITATIKVPPPLPSYRQRG